MFTQVHVIGHMILLILVRFEQRKRERAVGRVL